MLFNENFLEYVSKSSSSIDFMQALKRAKEESIKLQNQSSNDSTRIMERIKKYNLHLNPDTDNTGDCQFDSVADQLKLVDKKYDGITKEEVRIIAIDWLRKNGDYKLDSEDPQSETLRSWVYITQDCLDWNTYCDKMSKAREWGDEITFKSITEAFNVKIVLISSTVDEVNFISEHKPKTETEETKKLFLCHFLEVHYCSLITEKVLKENEEKKKDKLISLLKRANQTLQKKTILDVFCMDSPQNEIPRQFMEELIDSNELGLEELIDSLRNMTNVYTIKVHRITQLEEKVGPLSLEVPVNNNKTNSANGSKLVNTGVVENLNSKIKSLESMLEHRDKVVLEKDEEILILKRKLEEYAEYIDKQNLKIEQYEHNILKESSVPKKNELFVADILPKEIVLKFHLVDEPAQGYYAVLYKEENVFCEKQHLPTKSQGEIYFTKPEVVQKYCFKLYNPKHEVLATSPNFIISPKIIFNEPKIVDNYIDINWEIKEGKSSSYDWVGIFKFDNPKNHIQYFYNPPNNLNLLKFSIPTEKGQYKFQYFCGENKYLPVSERNFTV